MNVFSYESTPMQILNKVGDLIILNVLFIVCCIPIFTIGAAQAGLHNGVKVLLDKEDESSPSAAFFKGFSNGFFTVTLAWGLMTALLVLVILLGVAAVELGAPVWLVVVSICISATFQSLVPAFHSRFGCKPFQLIRNCLFLIMAHPLRSIAVAALTWLPVIALGFIDLYTYLSLMPVWGLFYYSTAFSFSHSCLKKPFKTLIDEFHKTHGNDSESATLQSEEATVSQS